jgi:hypothetical protein
VSAHTFTVAAKVTSAKIAVEHACKLYHCPSKKSRHTRACTNSPLICATLATLIAAHYSWLLSPASGNDSWPDNRVCKLAVPVQ